MAKGGLGVLGGGSLVELFAAMSLATIRDMAPRNISIVGLAGTP